MKIKFKVEIDDEWSLYFDNFRIDIDWESTFVFILDDDNLDYHRSFGNVQLNTFQYRRLFKTANNLISAKRDYIKMCDEIFNNEN